jgi:hypothetical protein
MSIHTIYCLHCYDSGVYFGMSLDKKNVSWTSKNDWQLAQLANKNYKILVCSVITLPLCLPGFMFYRTAVYESYIKHTMLYTCIIPVLIDCVICIHTGWGRTDTFTLRSVTNLYVWTLYQLIKRIAKFAILFIYWLPNC